MLMSQMRLSARIAQLKHDLDAAHKQIRELEAETARLREHKVSPVNGNSQSR
jgi:outer membrane murein-binding lipoprotein Lpp